MGQKFATYAADDSVMGFYDSDDSPLPAGMTGVELSDDLWASLLKAQGVGMLLKKGPDGLPQAVNRPPPTAEEILAGNQSQRDVLLSAASVAIAPLQLAVSLGEATDAETASAKAWIAYSRAVKAVDLTVAAPAWPAPPAASN
jgi:hypothetical protein